MMPTDSTSEGTVTDYDIARNDLFLEIFTHHGTSSFQGYWNSFRLFIIGQLSKEEFDVVVQSILTDEKGTILDLIWKKNKKNHKVSELSLLWTLYLLSLIHTCIFPTVYSVSTQSARDDNSR